MQQEIQCFCSIIHNTTICGWKLEEALKMLDAEMQEDFKNFTCHSTEEFNKIMNKINAKKLKNKTILFCEHLEDDKHEIK